MTPDRVDLPSSVPVLCDLASAAGYLRDATEALGDRVSPDEAEPMARLAKDVRDQLNTFATAFAGRILPEVPA